MRKKLLLLLTGLLTAATASAYDFSVDYNGKTLYYKINADGSGVSVTYVNLFTNNRYYSGSITIPPIVFNNKIGYKVNSIGEFAFTLCEGITDVCIPSCITSIGNKAFNNCLGLKDVTVENDNPNNIELGTDIFNNVDLSACTLHIPGGSREYYENAAPWKDFGTIVTIPTCDFEMPNADGVTIYYNFNEDDDGVSVTCRNKDFNSYSGNVVIPETVTFLGVTYTVTALGTTAFFRCTDLTSVTIPSTVKSLGDHALKNCPNLTAITIPESVETIGNYTFAYSTGITKVEIPSSVVSIGEQAFGSCHGLTEVLIPASVTYIGNTAFRRCTGLSKVTVENDNPSDIELGSGIFYEIPYATCTLFVPQGCKEKYETATQWCNFTNIVEYSDTEPGDINGDGEISSSDLGMLINMITGSVAETSVADINGDSDVNSADLGAVINIIVGI